MNLNNLIKQIEDTTIDNKKKIFNILKEKYSYISNSNGVFFNLENITTQDFDTLKEFMQNIIDIDTRIKEISIQRDKEMELLKKSIQEPNKKKKTFIKLIIKDVEKECPEECIGKKSKSFIKIKKIKKQHQFMKNNKCDSYYYDYDLDEEPEILETENVCDTDIENDLEIDIDTDETEIEESNEFLEESKNNINNFLKTHEYFESCEKFLEIETDFKN